MAENRPASGPQLEGFPINLDATWEQLVATEKAAWTKPGGL